MLNTPVRKSSTPKSGAFSCLPAQSLNQHKPFPRSTRFRAGQELDRAVTALAAALFDPYYNRCDLEKFASFFVDDVEFYHDQGGVTLGKVVLTNRVKKNICRQSHPRTGSRIAEGPIP
jgi:hypothetical protein